MNTIDLIVLLALAVAVWNGWRQGFVVQVCALAGIGLGIWLAARYGAAAGAWLGLDEEVAAPGGFAAVLVGVVLAVGVAARAVRGLFRFVGFGLLDTLAGVAVSAVKMLLVLSGLVAAFDALNEDHTLAGPQTVRESKSYRPLLRMSERIYPFLQRFGERIPQAEEHKRTQQA